MSFLGTIMIIEIITTKIITEKKDGGNNNKING